MGYVVYVCEHLRDGTDEHGKLFETKEAALHYINDGISRWFCSDNMTFKLFELGREVPLTQEEVELPQPSKKTRRFKG